MRDLAIGIFGIALAESASLKLHIYGDDRTPIRLASSNIFRWYFLRTIVISTENTGTNRRHTMSSTLFVTFENPVKINTLEVSSPDIQLPLFEVKDFNNRSAVVVFNEGLPAGTLEVTVHQ